MRRRAEVLLLTDADGPDALPDEDVADRLGTSRMTVQRVRHQFVAEGLDVTLHAVFLEARKRRTEFAEKVVPCVLENLPGLGYSDWEGRTKWRDHWKDIDIYERMGQQVRSLGKDDLNEWYEIGQWLSDVPDMLKFVANIATARGVESLRANNFAAVRAMLERLPK